MAKEHLNQMKPISPPTTKRFQDGNAVNTIPFVTLRDNFTITTWLLMGAILHGLLSLVLPAQATPYAVVAPALLLAFRIIDTLLMTLGVTRNRQMDGVIMGRTTAQIPDRQGVFPSKVADQDVTLIILATRSNHPLGIFGPGYREVGAYMTKMVTQLATNAEKYGYLGQTSWIAAGERPGANQVMTATYFRTAEDVHDYAHSPLHREAWNWWNRITKSHPHLSIMHEVYHAPKNHWENIFVNNHATGIAATQSILKAPVGTTDAQDLWTSTLVDASKGNLKTHSGRLGKSDGSDNDVFLKNGR